MNQTPSRLRALIRFARERFHPLFYARKSRLGRLLIRLADRPVWLSIPQVGFKVRGRLITHGLGFAMSGSMEKNPEALVHACISKLALRSFWDVGANIGHYSWLMKSADPNMELVLIEPLPENAALIRETITHHSLSHTTLIVAGASDSTGQGILHADKMAGATSSLEQQDQTFEERHWGVIASTLPVTLTTVDGVRTAHRPVDFMKIDVEGHEESVIRGAYETIRRDQPILFVECGHLGQTCLRRLEIEGYRIVDADRLSIKIAEHSTNFFCFPMRFTGFIDELLQQAREESDA